MTHTIAGYINALKALKSESVNTLRRYRVTEYGRRGRTVLRFTGFKSEYTLRRPEAMTLLNGSKSA